MIKQIVLDALWLQINVCNDLQDPQRASYVLEQLNTANTAVERFIEGVYTEDDWLDTIADLSDCDVDNYIDCCNDNLLHLGF